MPNRHYERGRRLEYAARKYLEELGYTVTRAAGSKGFADLVAFDREAILFVQVKTKRPLPSEIDKMRHNCPTLPPNGWYYVWWRERGVWQTITLERGSVQIPVAKLVSSATTNEVNHDNGSTT